MLNQKLHQTHLRRLLIDIFSNRAVSNSLAFKGGTCLYFFYELDRFSTDLDFNCVSSDLDVKALNSLFVDYEIQDYFNKFNTWFWLLSYQKTQMKIKIEISKRDYPDKYEIKELLGVQIPVMTKDCMFAHKLCAITDRKKLQNRDLYDAYFMLKNDFEINSEIIKIRTGKSLEDYLKYLSEFISKNAKPKYILEGLGEVLSEKQKAWVKEHLLQKLLFELSVRAE